MEMEQSPVADEEKKPLRTVGFAAKRAAVMYMKSRSERTATLKQCIAASSKQYCVPYSEIESYLAGAGARAIFASKNNYSKDDPCVNDRVTVYHLLYDDHDAFASDCPELVDVYDVDASYWLSATAEKRDIDTLEKTDPRPESVRRAIERASSDVGGI